MCTFWADTRHRCDDHYHFDMMETISVYRPIFDTFFVDVAARHLARSVRDALVEDGPDLTSMAVFDAGDRLKAMIVAKEENILAGVRIAPAVFKECSADEPGEWLCRPLRADGERIARGDAVLEIEGDARLILRCERIILNFIMHLSGIATLVRRYVDALEGTGVRLLDTRKTLPGLRYPEKYAVLVGGGCNHRKNLSEMLMLKDNHIDALGGIGPAVERLRKTYRQCPPIEVECRTPDEVREAVAHGVERIMLDNMLENGDEAMMRQSLELVPPGIEVEVSGGVTLENIGRIGGIGGLRRPDFVSVGRLTHSAPAVDYSMRITFADKI